MPGPGVEAVAPQKGLLWGQADLEGAPGRSVLSPPDTHPRARLKKTLTLGSTSRQPAQRVASAPGSLGKAALSLGAGPPGLCTAHRGGPRHCVHTPRPPWMAQAAPALARTPTRSWPSGPPALSFAHQVRSHGLLTSPACTSGHLGAARTLPHSGQGATHPFATLPRGSVRSRQAHPREVRMRRHARGPLSVPGPFPLFSATS